MLEATDASLRPDSIIEQFLNDTISTIRGWRQSIKCSAFEPSAVKKATASLPERILAIILANRFCRTKGNLNPNWNNIVNSAVNQGRPIPLSSLCLSLAD